MDKRDEILNELKEITPLADQFSVENPYTLPAGYFSDLPERIMTRIKGNLVVKEADYQKLQAGTLSRSKDPIVGWGGNPMQETAALTATVPVEKENAGLPEHGPSMRPDKKFLLLRITMAAAVAGLLALGGWWYFNSLTEGSNQIAKTGNRITKTDNQITARNHQIITPDNQQATMNNRNTIGDNQNTFEGNPNRVTGNWITIPDNATLDSVLLERMQNMSETEISHYMESSVMPLFYDSMAASARIKDEDIKWMLADISDAELQNFLERDGDILYN